MGWVGEREDTVRMGTRPEGETDLIYYLSEVGGMRKDWGMDFGEVDECCFVGDLEVLEDGFNACGPACEVVSEGSCGGGEGLT